MNGTKKRNIIIGILCTVLLLMVVGYAAFQSVLKINGTSSISSNWDVKITAIEQTASLGATDKEAPSYDNTKGLSATFNTNLTSPGDYATYKITITNSGSLDALLKNITIPENTNNDIIFYLNKDQNDQDISGALKQDDTLTKVSESNNVGYVYVTVLYKDYANQQTAQAKTANMTINFDFEQASGSSGPIIGPAGDDETASDKLINTAVTSGDGLYADTYEPGRYVYKGANPNNYITFNNETWRIISVEVDGSLKIMRKDMLPNRAFDSKGYRDSTSNGAGGTYCATSTYGCNAWATSNNFVNGSNSGTVLKDAEINTYLNSITDTNSYYNTLNSEAKSLIQEHTWGIGLVTYNNKDLATQITSENGITWSGNIGLISASDFLRANTNISQCGNLSLHSTNKATCKNTNYLVPASGYYWTISPRAGNTFYVFAVYNNGLLSSYDYASGSEYGVLPALYLIPNITLDGEGTSSSPYTIVS